MKPKNPPPAVGTPELGKPENGVAPVGADRLSAGLEDLGRRLPDASTGGPTAPAPVASAARPLSELSRRVLGRWGALPLKAIQVALGWGVDTHGTDAELLGECTLDLVGHSNLVLDPAAEARARWLVAHGLALGEGLLAAYELKVEAARKKTEADAKP